MIKYKNKLGLCTKSFKTTIENLDKDIGNKLNLLDINNKGFNINVEDIIINSMYRRFRSHDIEEQNVIIVYTLIEESEKVQI